jgi:hypothetical protein
MAIPTTKLHKLMKWAYVIVAVALLANASRLIYARLRVQPQTVKPVPHTVILRETVHSPNRTATISSDVTWAVRSDGSLMRRLAHKKDIGGKMVDADSERSITFASGSQVDVNDFADTKSTTALKDANTASLLRDPGSKCINSFAGAPMTVLPEVIRGEEIVDGYRAVKITANEFTWWFALDFGCAMIKSRYDWGPNSFTEKKLVALIPGEPAAAIFNIPPDNKEMRPSERILGLGKSASDCGAGCADILRDLDEHYKANRPKN